MSIEKMIADLGDELEEQQTPQNRKPRAAAAKPPKKKPGEKYAFELAAKPNGQMPKPPPLPNRRAPSRGDE
jgi:hypothetical protein